MEIDHPSRQFGTGTRVGLEDRVLQTGFAPPCGRGFLPHGNGYGRQIRYHGLCPIFYAFRAPSPAGSRPCSTQRREFGLGSGIGRSG